jgi:hypothetical protein
MDHVGPLLVERVVDHRASLAEGDDAGVELARGLLSQPT